MSTLTWDLENSERINKYAKTFEDCLQVTTPFSSATGGTKIIIF